MFDTTVNNQHYYTETPMGMLVKGMPTVESDAEAIALMGWETGEITLPRALPETLSFLVGKSRGNGKKVLKTSPEAFSKWFGSDFWGFDTISIREKEIEIILI